jgi:DNA-directed RNA polymerase subunit L
LSSGLRCRRAVCVAALEHLIRLRIQTKEETTPMEVLNDAVNALILEVNKMEDQFSDQVEEYKRQNPQDM